MDFSVRAVDLAVDLRPKGARKSVVKSAVDLAVDLPWICRGFFRRRRGFFRWCVSKRKWTRKKSPAGVRKNQKRKSTARFFCFPRRFPARFPGAFWGAFSGAFSRPRFAFSLRLMQEPETLSQALHVPLKFSLS